MARAAPPARCQARRALPVLLAGSALAVALRALLGQRPLAAGAFVLPSPAASPSRREAAAAAAAGLLWASAPVASSAELEPLPPPVVKDVQLSATKIQRGCDWFYFELKPALVQKSLPMARSAIGSASQGSFVSPLQKELMFPLQQIVSANLDAEEDGWRQAFVSTNTAIEDMKEHIGTSDFDQALEAFERARKNVNLILTNIDDRWEDKKKPFRLLDASYEADRAALYLKEKKDMLNQRNAQGGAGAALSILR